MSRAINYGKSNTDYFRAKSGFYDADENAHNIAVAEKVSAKYTDQPLRTGCVACDAPLGPAQFTLRFGVPYSICARCGHLNWMHHDTAEFAEFACVAGTVGESAIYADIDRAAFDHPRHHDLCAEGRVPDQRVACARRDARKTDLCRHRLPTGTEVYDWTVPKEWNVGDARIGPEGAPEILVATYCCHPSMANNELSGPVLTQNLYQVLSRIPGLRYSYRFLFMPETIGPIAYMTMFGDVVKTHTVAGYVVSCVGDDGPYTYKKSRRGDSAADLAALHMLKHYPQEGTELLIHDYFPDHGGDERQYNSPGFNLPVGSLLRSNAGTYREYHTSLDDMNFVSARGMGDSLAAYLRIFQTLEMNARMVNTKPNGEPRLGKYGLYPDIGIHPRFEGEMRYLTWLLCYCDGERDLMEIADNLDRPIWALSGAVDSQVLAGLQADEL